MTPSNRRLALPADAGDDERGPSASTSDASRSRLAAAAVVAKTVFGLALIVAGSVGMAWAAHRHVTTSARFAIATIAVDGNERRPSDAVVAESGLAVGSNVFAADLDAARARLVADPWITDAVLARRLPGTISIHVVERQAAALVALGDTFLATADGEPFKKLAPDDPIDLPIVTGLRPEDLGRDHDGTTRAIRVAIDLAAEYGRGPIAKRSPLEEIHVDPDGGFSLVVGRSGVELVLGGPPFRRKLDQAARVFAELDKRGAKADAVMLDNDTRPERVVVRMR